MLNRRCRQYYIKNNYRCKEKKKKYYIEHREQELQRRKRYINSPEGRNKYLLRTYGINYEQYKALIIAQNNRCAICGFEFIGVRPCVDHDHKSGKVRGLLCQRCNRCLGQLEESLDLMRAMMVYLE
jgi:hypothetical protein